MRSRWTESQLDILDSRYHLEGASLLAKEFGFKIGTVHKMASARGLTANKTNRYLRSGKTIRNGNTSVNQKYFENWTFGMAYTLGYLWADGTLNKTGYSIQFECLVKDEDIILAIRDDMQSTQTVYQRKESVDSRGIPRHAAVMFHVNSANLVDTLIKMHGVVPRKTYANCSFPEVPNEYLSDFVRGYSDGDGCISKTTKRQKWSWCLVGSKLFIDGLQQQVSTLLNLSPRNLSGPHNNIYYVTWGRKSDLLTLYDWLYPNDKNFISGRRKRLLWERMKSDYITQVKDL